MRKNSPRKWLHACLDLLPVILIPVFMIYSHRHTIEGSEVVYAQNETRDIQFNQLFVGDVSNSYVQSNSQTINFTDYDTGRIQTLMSFSAVAGHQYYLRYEPVYTNLTNPSGVTYFIWFTGNSQNVGIPFNSYDNIVTLNSTANYNLNIRDNETAFVDTSITLNVYDLTLMCGSGNEFSISQVRELFPQNVDYYVESELQRVVVTTNVVTYNDSDVLSQFTYQMYNAVDKYFNMGNVFNLGQVYQWFNVNIFHGVTPIYIYIVWNIVLYEFVMDLLFLLYGLFMWFIDMCEHLMDKPFKSIK